MSVSNIGGEPIGGGGGGGGGAKSSTVTVTINGETQTFDLSPGQQLTIGCKPGNIFQLVIGSMNAPSEAFAPIEPNRISKPADAVKVPPTIEQHETIINHMIEGMTFEPLTHDKIVGFNQLLERVAKYNEEMEGINSKSYTFTKVYNYLYSAAVTTTQALINKNVDELKGKFTKKSFERISQLLGEGASSTPMRMADRQAAKRDIIAIVGSLEKIGSIGQLTPQQETLLGSAELLFGLVGLTKSSKEKIALVSQEQMQERIAGSNELLEYALSMEGEMLPEGFFRVSGDSDIVNPGVAAYTEGGISALKTFIESQDAQPEVLRNIVKTVLNRNFGSITVIDPDRFPLYFSTILKMVACGDSQRLSLKSVYIGLPIARDSCLPIEEELRHFAHDLETLKGDNYTHYKESLSLPDGSRLREGDLIKLIFYPNLKEPAVSEDFHKEIIGKLQEGEKYPHLSKMLSIIIGD